MQCNCNKVLVRKFETVTGLTIYVNMDNVARIWEEPEGEQKGQTAIMYNGGIVDHVKQSLREVFKC